MRMCLFLCVSAEIQLSVAAPPCLDKVCLRWGKKKRKGKVLISDDQRVHA